MVVPAAAFRVGRVRAYRRNRTWYLSYFEHGKRRQPRVGTDRAAARQLAAQINAQLETGVPSLFGFQPLSIAELRQRWLDHHEHVRRSSLQTIRRYRSATQHLIDFVCKQSALGRAADFGSQHAEDFVRYLRHKKVASNGHAKARQRPLRDAGIKFILETCCSLFNYAAKHRHLPPYADNPFRVIEVHRIIVEDARPIVPFTAGQERTFLEACDDWQFPLFLTLFCTGLRPGELVHLLLPDDLDLVSGWLHIRNKPRLGWQVKTRNERDIPLVPALRAVLKQYLARRRTGPVFLQRRCRDGYLPPLLDLSVAHLEHELSRRILARESESAETSTRAGHLSIAKTIWRDLGAIREDWVRKEFMQITRSIGMPELTAPKTLRHTFATLLQDANVDPLIRNELMGHCAAAGGLSGVSLGMTAVYSHTRPETKRQQLEHALASAESVAVAQQWLLAKHSTV